MFALPQQQPYSNGSQRPESVLKKNLGQLPSQGPRSGGKEQTSPSGGQNPSRIYEVFVQACLANERGLVVDTVQRFKSARSGQDGRFELVFRPGIELRPASEEGRKIVLRHMSVEGEDDERVFVGRRADGVLLRIPSADVDSKQRDDLYVRLQNK